MSSRPWAIRRAALLLLVASVSCADGPGPVGVEAGSDAAPPGPRSDLLVDGSTTGNSHFFFLPPLANRGFPSAENLFVIQVLEANSDRWLVFPPASGMSSGQQ